MNKLLRRYLWLISGFARQYWALVIISLAISIVLGLSLVSLNRLIPSRRLTYRLGVIGLYTNQNLPPLVKNILNAGLTKVGPDQVIVPNLAETWEIDSEGKSYTFHLKNGLTWDDSSPLLAREISLIIPSVGIEFPDDRTVKFILPETFAPFPSLLTAPLTDKKGHTASRYQVNLTQSGGGTLSRLELTSPDLRLIIHVFPNANAAFTAYRLGELDAIFGLPKDEGLNLTHQGTTKETEVLHQSVGLFFNLQDPLLKSKSFRQGLAYLIRDKTIGNTRSLSPINPASWAYNPLVKTYDYDPDRGLRLIQNALTDKESSVNLELAVLPQYLPLAETIKNQLAAHRINLEIKVVTSRPENFQLFLTLFESPVDPDQYVFWHSTQATNKSHLDDERIDKALEDGRRTLDQNERKKIYAEFQRTFAEELPALFLYHPLYLNLARNEALFAIINPATAL